MSAVGLSVAAVALGQLGLWQYARTEGGVLPPLDYLGAGLRPARAAPVRDGGDRRVADRPVSDDIRFRRPTEADHARLVGLVDDWWGGRKVHQLLPRLWFQHFTGTSWVAEDDGGRLVGFLVGFISPDHPDEAYVHMVGTGPNHRRAGLGRTLYERFFEESGRAARDA